MSGLLSDQDREEWLGAMRQAAAERAASIEAHCEAVEEGVRTFFDERPEQRATLTGLLNEFERGGDGKNGFGAFCIGQAARRTFVEESSFGWVRAEELRTAARLAWEQAARELKPVAQTRFATRWSAAQKPNGAKPGTLGDAVFAGAPEVAQLFGEDFEFTATAATRKLCTAFGAFLGLPHQSLWQTGYWVQKPAVDPPPPAPPGLLEQLLAWVRRRLGRPVEMADKSPRFVRGDVTLAVLPRPAAMQRTLWSGHDERRAEAGRLDEDVAAWVREFSNSEQALDRGGERQRKANEPIPRTASAEQVAGSVRQACDLTGAFAALREKNRAHLAAS